MKKACSLSLLVVLIMAVYLMLSYKQAGECRRKERVLVLGFSSWLINDLQDRLLREMIMKRLHRKGYTIVPVMKVESLSLGERRRRIRELGRSEVRNICREFQSNYVIYGSLFPKNKRYRTPSIMAEKKFICSIVLYRSGTDTFHRADIVTIGRTPLYDYFTHVTDKVIARVADLMK